MRIKDKALAVIEGLTLEAKSDVAETCYKFAHIARGQCKNQHPAWVAELDTLYQSLKKAKII